MHYHNSLNYHNCHVYDHFAKTCPKLAESQKPANTPANTDTDFQTVSNRRHPPRRKEPQASQQKASQDHSPLADTPRPENKNSFAVLQEEEAQEPETAVVQDQGNSGPIGSLDVPKQASPKQASPKTASPGSKKDPRALIRETSAQAGPASLIPSSEGTSDSENSSAPSPPLTRGRKTNKERREKEIASNISSGSQKKLDPFIKGLSSPPI